MARGTVRPTLKLAESDLYLSGLGFVSYNRDPAINAASTALTSQTIYSMAVPLRQGQVVSNVCLQTVVAASGTAPTNAYVAIMDSTRTILVKSSDIAANAGWSATIGVQAFPLSASFTATYTGLHWAVVLVNGTWSVTQPTFNRGPGGYAPIGAVYPYATNGTGQTALPNVAATTGAFSASGALAYWAAFS